MLGIAAVGVLIFLVVIGVIVVQPSKLKTALVGSGADGQGRAFEIRYDIPLLGSGSHGIADTVEIVGRPSFVSINDGEILEGINAAAIFLTTTTVGEERGHLGPVAERCYQLAVSDSMRINSTLPPANPGELHIGGVAFHAEVSGNYVQVFVSDQNNLDCFQTRVDG